MSLLVIYHKDCNDGFCAAWLAEGRPFGVVYFDRVSGGQLKRVFSLRCRCNGIDVSELAKSKGGGGHPQAAGYTVDINLEL